MSQRCVKILLILTLLVGLVFTTQTSILAASERQSPDAILAISNLSPNDVSYIQDDPDTPDLNWLVATSNNVNNSVRVSFPTPTGNPTVGADLQEFKAWVRQYDEGQGGTPDVRLELWEDGVLIRAGSDEAVPDGGKLISFTWNANEIGTADGSLVQIMVVGTKSGGSPSNRNSIDVGAVEWNVEYSDASPDISNLPISQDFGAVSENGTYETGLTYFTVTNNSSGAVTITIKAIDFTGGAGWALSDTATPGANTAGLKAGLEGGDYTIIVKKTETFNTLVTGLAAEGTQKWGLKLYTPTTFSDGVQKSTTVTLTATLD